MLESAQCLTIAGTATVFPLRLRLHYKAARAAGVRCTELEPFFRFTSFLDELNERNIHFNLEYNRTGYVMVCIAVPGERWEVEFDPAGNIEVEIFRSGGPNSGLEGEEAIERLFKEFSD